jgi:hypothetical protein
VVDFGPVFMKGTSQFMVVQKRRKLFCRNFLRFLLYFVTLTQQLVILRCHPRCVARDSKCNVCMYGKHN